MIKSFNISRIHFNLAGLLLVICCGVGTASADDEAPAARTKRLEGQVKSRSQTTIDFNETLIDGKMQAPSGFFIQGRQSQSMSQMVKLRSNFRDKLIQSKYAVRAIVK
jgi:hypothetical protein